MRRKVMDNWATFCAQPAAVGDNVRPIRATGRYVRENSKRPSPEGFRQGRFSPQR